MKFIISRTSAWEGRPCKEAKKEKLTHLDYRTVKTLKEARKHKVMNSPISWFANGQNHREENGMVVRDMEFEYWTIECENILDLYDRYGSLVIQDSECKEYPIEIEIYDGYRE